MSSDRRRCDCGNQLHAALAANRAKQAAACSFTCARKGAASDCAAKIHAYKLQEEGLDTVEANAQARLSRPICAITDWARRFLFDLGVRKFRFLTNNPKKVVGLEGYGMQMVEQVPIRSDANPHNAKYLETKKMKMGHLL